MSSRDQIEAAGAAITTAAHLIRRERPVMEAFLRERSDASERSAVGALMDPLFRTALDFLRAYELQLERAREALEKVQS